MSCGACSVGEGDSVTAPVAIHTLTIACHDAVAAARFWRDLLGYAVVANHTSSIHLRDPAGRGPDLLFAWTDEAKGGQNRIHLDLRPEDQDLSVRRARELGATFADVGQSEQASWIVLRDPAGNEFCLLQSPADLSAWEETAPPPTAPDLGS